jgi:NitT/TauT family transport system ATP-binding protein/sulfonate transport system ATP-binding protein
VVIDGQAVHGMSRERAVIFQEPRLLPWLTVLENVSFSLDVQGVPRKQARARAKEAIELVGLATVSRRCRTSFPAAWLSVSELPAP